MQITAPTFVTGVLDISFPHTFFFTATVQTVLQVMAAIIKCIIILKFDTVEFHILVYTHAEHTSRREAHAAINQLDVKRRSSL